QTVDTGTYWFSEDSTGLGNYDTSFGCTGAAATPTKLSNYNYSLVVAKGETVVCTFTNTRQQGSVELKKVWVGPGGQTTLNIGTAANGTHTAAKRPGASGGTPLSTGTKTVDTGTYYVSESGGLTGYSSSLACTKNGSDYSPGSSNSVTVGKNDVVVCTFTN